MKTTIELPDQLLDQIRILARQEGSSLRQLMEEGLQRTLAARQQPARAPIRFPVFGGSGLTEEFEGAGWERMRDEIYPAGPGQRES
jgi:hypothetical protein